MPDARHLRPAVYVLAGMIFLAFTAFGKYKELVPASGDFSRYKTYQWLPTRVLAKTGLIENDDVVAPAIKKAVERELTRLGLTEVAEGADFEVAAGAFRAAIPQVEAYFFPGRLDWTIGTAPSAIGRYNHEGTIVINLIDCHTKKSAWAALSSGSFEKQDQLDSRVNHAASEIFRKYPGKAKK
jgi:hypothetical protein